MKLEYVHKYISNNLKTKLTKESGHEQKAKTGSQNANCESQESQKGKGLDGLREKKSG